MTPTCARAKAMHYQCCGLHPKLYAKHLWNLVKVYAPHFLSTQSTVFAQIHTYHDELSRTATTDPYAFSLWPDVSASSEEALVIRVELKLAIGYRLDLRWYSPNREYAQSRSLARDTDRKIDRDGHE
jgi:hypothetical protein